MSKLKRLPIVEFVPTVKHQHLCHLLRLIIYIIYIYIYKVLKTFCNFFDQKMISQVSMDSEFRPCNSKQKHYTYTEKSLAVLL